MSKIDRKQVVSLIELIGGQDNIASVSHCLTRLRFALIDPELADLKKIEKIAMVKGCFTNAGQFQVVIGTEVDQVHKILTEITGGKGADKEATKLAARQNMNLLERSISHMAEIFVPLLPAIITGGLILGFRNVIGDIRMFDGKTLVEISQFWASLHSFLWLLGEAIFHFLPVGVCWATVRKLGGTPILGIVLGITLVSPQLMNAYGIGSGTPEVWDFGFFAMEKVGYQAQVIPAILAGMALAMIETNLKRIIPAYLYLVVVPFVSLLTAVVLAHSIIGPLGREIGDGVGYVAKAAMTGDFAVLGSMVFAFFYAPLVITGIHHTTNAVDLQLMQDLGGTPIWPLIALSNIAQASSVVGIIWISKKHNEREISVPAAISAYLGVTEPAMYGINLKYKFPMLCAMAGSALAAGICGFAGVMANGIGVGGLPGILSIQPQYWGVYALAMLVAVVVPIILTLLLYKRAQKRGDLEDLELIEDELEAVIR
ncbi:PTS trehalose transporter subunit IIBC [Psychromonas ossibalaenae]|uniref:PTS trehalose transporter subunit IIBC n=1 Tax=Psychromonas ossibalaenae TaxID=444922 RepID=UPI00036B9D3A|nr:PTS trehalose transporter subunit IIBC [Psychromonas ossibalaenae]